MLHAKLSVHWRLVSLNFFLQSLGLKNTSYDKLEVRFIKMLLLATRDSEGLSLEWWVITVEVSRRHILPSSQEIFLWDTYILIGVAFIQTHCLVQGAFSKEDWMLTFQFFYPAQVSSTHSLNSAKTGILSLLNMSVLLWLCIFSFT